MQSHWQFLRTLCSKTRTCGPRTRTCKLILENKDFPRGQQDWILCGLQVSLLFDTPLDTSPSRCPFSLICPWTRVHPWSTAQVVRAENTSQLTFASIRSQSASVSDVRTLSSRRNTRRLASRLRSISQKNLLMSKSIDFTMRSVIACNWSQTYNALQSESGSKKCIVTLLVRELLLFWQATCSAHLSFHSA